MFQDIADEKPFLAAEDPQTPTADIVTSRHPQLEKKIQY